ncbi:MAG TPA: AbrB/MazE/SpoVT family DNA-binding domain-containing protein [Candidatus Nanoarchaeia archaeon]|nr:AbrB/MazE/SpoVT family DNA-binding domain-containing protein [Candidatus Nanoarchaeia archaeon]
MQEEIKEIRTVTITQKGQISIPRIARTLAGFKEGTKISLVVYADRVELKPLKKINEDILPVLISEEVLAEAWDNPEEDEIWKDL